MFMVLATKSGRVAARPSRNYRFSPPNWHWAPQSMRFPLLAPMPDMSGYEAITPQQKNQASQRIPIRQHDVVLNVSIYHYGCKN
jgi:hypothetical protein